MIVAVAGALQEGAGAAHTSQATVASIEPVPV